MAGSLVVSPHRAVTLVAGTGASSIFAGAAIRLKRVTINAALVGTLTIVGFSDNAGSAASFVLPIGFVGSIELDDSIATGVTFTKSSASDDGKVLVTFADV